MTKLIALDDGHGMQTGGKRTEFIGSLGRYIPENEFNRAMVGFLDTELKRCGFKTLLTAPTDADTSLSARVNLANSRKADLFLSIHYNAITGKFATSKAEGFSAHVNSLVGNSAKLGKVILKHLAGGTPQKNRGLVVQNLAVTRDTKMPAVLLELGFMDNLREALLMIDVAFQKECAQEVAKAVCEFYGVTYKSAVTVASKPAPVAPVTKPTVKPALKGIGIAEVTTPTLNFRKDKKLDAPLIRVLKAKEKYTVYAVDGMWYNLGNGWASAGSKGDLLRYTPHPKPVVVVPKPTPKPVETPKPAPAPSSDLYRVKINGKQVGAYSEDSNIVHEVKEAIKGGAKDITIEKV